METFGLYSYIVEKLQAWPVEVNIIKASFRYKKQLVEKLSAREATGHWSNFELSCIFAAAVGLSRDIFECLLLSRYYTTTLKCKGVSLC